jgi:hypothetical protein
MEAACSSKTSASACTAVATATLSQCQESLKQTNSMALNPQANYTDDRHLLAKFSTKFGDCGVLHVQRGRPPPPPPVVNLSFLDRSR